MKISEHALKKFDCIIGAKDLKRQNRFSELFLYTNLKLSWQNRKGLYRTDLLTFGERCEKFGVKLLGLETIFDSVYPLHIVTYEDFSVEYDIQWLIKAVQYFEKWNIEMHIVPSLHISKAILDDYLYDEVGNED